MVIARVRVCLKSKAALELEAGVAAEVADVPEGVGLALEEGDDDGAAAGERGGGRGEGALEEGDEQLLVVADLAVDVCGLAADVGEVEDDSVVGDAGDGGRELGGVDVVDQLVVDDGCLALLGIDRGIGIVVLAFIVFIIVVVIIAVRLTVCIGIGPGAVTGGIRAAVDDGNVGIHGGVLCYQLGMVLFQDRRRDVCAAVVLDDGRGKAQVALSHQQDAVAGAEGDHGLVVLLLAVLLGRLGLEGLLRLALFFLLRTPGRSLCCLLASQLPPFCHWTVIGSSAASSGGDAWGECDVE